MAEQRSELSSRVHELVFSHIQRVLDYAERRGQELQSVATDLVDDPLFHLFGLDTPKYVALAAGGGAVTSVHRKIGDAMEAAVDLIFCCTLGLQAEQTCYTGEIRSGETVVERSIDTYLCFNDLNSADAKRISQMCDSYVRGIVQHPKVIFSGLGIEVRQCYQSADSKRVQADEAMARHLLLSGLYPIALFFCTHSNRSILERYESTWIVREGWEAFQFVKAATGFDLYETLESHSHEYRAITEDALSRFALGS